ncbi:DUF1418 family protein [Erwinia pyrifoliae]|uniref:DUF1418 family protein n=1 Tax=Erwinia pyrifoliae TaxID=79967 RepID=A0ABY5X4C1_ERWPY|nr:DUF1418 family protein [Erwinia pyrifoliae]AUX72239.1 hypothetical protein CPI84_06965 [Erwinia pyrifoliae]MCA8877521.1 DUF1418 family protein [Erwinia pyrifoliae]MCT2388489.1 DUF1418 family protein [Erwinia pyrifoliae]MCU8586658.1 DUF1418 family protein [Erwinia pyrifoliae]UWS30545.1 DUF1418 family protein [Erwinia pyrifoliae]
MRAFSQLSRPVLLLEVLGIALLVAAPLALHERLPWPLSGKPAATVKIWRCAKIIAPALFSARSLRDKPKPGYSHDPDH